MDKKEARELLDDLIAEVRAVPYHGLRERIAPARWSLFGGRLDIGGGGEPEIGELTGPSGTWYQTEVQVFSDHKKGGDLRMLASIDDGGRSAFRPMTDGFIMAPDGSFVGE